MAAKKKFDLDSSIVNVERGVEHDVPASDSYPKLQEPAKIEPKRSHHIHLTVTEEFKKEFRLFCFEKELQLNEAIEQMFECVKKHKLM